MNQTLVERVEGKAGLHQERAIFAAEASFEHLAGLNTARSILARELEWGNSVEWGKITDSRISALIRAQRKAEKTGVEWFVSDTVKAAVGFFVDERQSFRRAKNTAVRHSREIGDLSVLSAFIRTGEENNERLNIWLERESNRKRINTLSRDLIEFVTDKRRDKQNTLMPQEESITAVDQLVAEEPLLEREYGISDSRVQESSKKEGSPETDPMPEVFREISENHRSLTYRPPEWADQWVTALDSHRNTVEEGSELSVAGASEGKIRGFLKRMREMPGKILTKAGQMQLPDKVFWAGAILASGILLSAAVNRPSFENKNVPAIMPNNAAASVSVPENTHSDCPYYDAIALYNDWKPEIICAVAEQSSGNDPKVEIKNSDGSYGMGILQLNSEVMKKMDPDMDPEHIRNAFREDPALAVVWGHHYYKQVGYAAFPACLDGRVDCWPALSESSYQQQEEFNNQGSLLSETPRIYHQAIFNAAFKYNIPPRLLSAVLWQASRFNPKARSSDESLGIAQFQKETADERGIDPMDSQQAIDGAAGYLSELYDEFKDWYSAIAAYNAGPSVVRKYKGVPFDYKGTVYYVASVWERFSVADKLSA